jgi:hypothetical protein
MTSAETQAQASVAVGTQGPSEFSWAPFLPWWALVLLAAAVLAAAARSYARSTRPISFGRRAALWCLRAAAALALVLCLARPVLVRARVLEEKGLCFILLDTSASMNLRDAAQGLSRWEFAGRFFAEHQAELAELGRRHEIRRFLFDAAPRETPRLPGEDAAAGRSRPEGVVTDLTAALERLAAEGAGTQCAGALLLSDGRHNAPRDPLRAAQLLRNADLPLFIAGLGQESCPADYTEVQVRLLEVPERAFIESQMQMRIEVAAQTRRPLSFPLTVTVNGEKVREEPLSLAPGRESHSVEIPYRPTKLGLHRVTASAPVLPRETNPNNNSRTAFFRVYRSKLGVRYLEGAIRKEFGALRSALETAPNLDFYACNAIARDASDELLPRDQQGWKELRLLILGDLPARRFRRADLETVTQWVEQGGAVLILGGVDNLGAGGWHDTPLARVLPAVLSPLDRGVDEPLPVALEPGRPDHPAVKLSADPVRSRELWKLLPPMPGVSTVAAVKPAAQVPLRAGAHPLLMLQDFGKGRSAIFTGDATWQWLLKAGQPDAHRTFWRTLVTWLTRSEYRDTDRVVFADSDRLLYLAGDEVQLTAVVQASEALQERLAAARVLGHLELQGGPVCALGELGRGLGEHRTRQAPQLPGAYTFRAEVLDAEGKLLGGDRVNFQVEVIDREADDPRADPALLRRLAAAAGGSFYDESRAGEALRDLLQRPAGFSKTVRESRDLWNHWMVFVLFAAFLVLEWMLRRRWGLV